MLAVFVHVHYLRYIIIFILVSSRYVAGNKNQGDLRTIGGIVDYLSSHGKEEKVAMEMAIKDSCAYVPLPCGVALHFMNSGKDPLKAASSGKVSSSCAFYTFKYFYFISTNFAALIMRLAVRTEDGFLSKDIS